MKNKNFIRSARHAIDGFIGAYKEERNLRFHIFAAGNVCIFAYSYGINRQDWAILLLTITAVISLELLNTAVERAVDTATEEFMPAAKLAKDAAAAAVLISALGAVLIGMCLFGNIYKISNTIKNIITNRFTLIFLIVFELVNICVMIKNKKKFFCRKGNNNER